MNKKVYTTILMIVLMVFIVFMRYLFIRDIEKISISNNNIERFTSYTLREGKYFVLLPYGWDIDMIDDQSSDVIATFNNEENIQGSIYIVSNSNDNVYNNIKENMDSSIIIEDSYRWKVITEKNQKNINNYYIRDYSEGKILIVKFSYTEGKVKNSIKVVFKYIANSFA